MFHLKLHRLLRVELQDVVKGWGGGHTTEQVTD